MKTQIKDKFVFSERNANMFGYNIGMKEDGATFSYTTVISQSRENYRPEYEIEGDTVYEGTVDDLIAIKRYNGNESQYIKNTTNQIDPFTSFKENNSHKQDVHLHCCDFTKNFCNKVKQLNKKIMKNIEKEFKDNSDVKN